MGDLKQTNHSLPTKKNRRNNGAFLTEIIKNKYLYLMALPGILFFIIFCYVPMYGAIIAFKDYAPTLGVFGSPWVGFKHFEKFFESVYFLRVLKNTIGLSVYGIVVGFPMPIILALLLNEVKNKKFKGFVQTVTYIPHFISVVVIAGMIVNFSMKEGLFNIILSYFGVPSENLLLKPELFKSIYVFSSVWQQTGWNSIIYLAALTSIDSCLYEAAEIDGAGKWKQMIHVTIPGISSTIIVLLIMQLGSIMNVGFEKVILLYNAMTMETADVISSYVYRKGIIDNSFSFSTAVGLFNSVINVIMLVIANTISKKVNETSLW